MAVSTTAADVLQVGSHRFASRLIVGTGKYATYELMREALAASGTECVTVAVRRERLLDAQGQNLLDFIDTSRYTILPNTAGCFTAEDAVRVARLGREILSQMGNAGADWVKLEVLGDKRTLLPDPVATIEATKQLVAEGFQVLVYTSDDAVIARRLKEAGAASVMPAGSPIGSGQGVLNPNAIRICLEYLKEGDPDYPVIVDAGRGHGQRRGLGHGTGRRRRPAQHGHRPCRRSPAHGPGHAVGHGGRPAGLSGRPHSQAALRHSQQPDRRHDCRCAVGGRGLRTPPSCYQLPATKYQLHPSGYHLPPPILSALPRFTNRKTSLKRYGPGVELRGGAPHFTATEPLRRLPG